MLKELFDAVCELARKSVQPTTFHPAAEPPDVYRIQNTDGVLSDLIIAQPRPRGYVLYSLEHFADAVERAMQQGPAAADANTLVFCGRGGVLAVLDETTNRREMLKVNLPESTEFTTLKTLERQRAAMDQETLIKRLRIDLALAVAPADLATFRAIKFEKRTAGQASVQTGASTLGLDVERKITCDGKAPPDEITVNVCVYRDLAGEEYRKPVRCAVDTDLEKQTFTLIPMAGEIERAQAETDQQIHDKLVDLLPTGVDVVCGAVK